MIIHCDSSNEFDEHFSFWSGITTKCATFLRIVIGVSAISAISFERFRCFFAVISSVVLNVKAVQSTFPSGLRGLFFTAWSEQENCLLGIP